MKQAQRDWIYSKLHKIVNEMLDDDIITIEYDAKEGCVITRGRKYKTLNNEETEHGRSRHEA